MVTLCLLSTVFVGCVDEDQYSNDVEGNFEALWKIFDEHYCFFDFKKETLGVDWDEVHQSYRAMINPKMSEAQQFELFCRMIGELRDGHVNLTTSFDYGRNWSWQENYPANFSDSLHRLYMGTDYKIAAGMEYRILDDNIGYVYYGSFSSAIGEGNLDKVLMYLATCNGLILDIRNNSGGLLSNAEKLAARFTNEELLVGYMQHKDGKGRNDFSKMEEQLLKPSNGMRWQKSVVVLTNRSVFSAANEFVKYMKCCPKVTVVGDHTGGGAGMPFSSELPCGWSVRFSACPMYDKTGQCTEFGIDPDYWVQQAEGDFERGRDTILEFARRLLHQP